MGTFFHLQGIGFNDDWIAVGQIQNKEWAGKHKLFGHHVNLAGRRAFQQICRFIAPVVEYAIQNKTNGVVGDDRRLAGPGKEPEQVIQHLLAAPVPGYDFYRQAAPGRREKMGDGGPFRELHFRENSIRRNGTRIRRDNRIPANDLFDHRKYFLFERNIFSGSLNHQFTIFDLIVIGCINDIISNCGSLFRLHLFSINRLVGISVDAMLGPLQGLFHNVDQKKPTIRHGTL